MKAISSLACVLNFSTFKLFYSVCNHMFPVNCAIQLRFLIAHSHASVHEGAIVTKAIPNVVRKAIMP